jgi:Tol biopolymer transport system component
MEFVPGKPLSEVITPKGLPLVQAINYTSQIASALAVAHASGIVHRDIKPANIMVTAESQVKILDFGVAKLLERFVASEDDTLKLESPLTEAGTVIGTANYMSPEQANARQLDYRTDIFSLGVVTYEMIAGARPFRGESQLEILHAIVFDPAPVLAHQAPELNEILSKVLAKDPNDRFQHACDFSLDLRRFQTAWQAGKLISQQPPLNTTRTRRTPWAMKAAAILLCLAGTWWVGRHGAPLSIDNPLAKAQFTRLTDFQGDEFNAAISRDGKFAAFLSDRNTSVDAYVTQIGSGISLDLTHGKEAVNLSIVRELGFSPDGSEIWLAGAMGVARLRLVPLMGGTPRPFLNDHVVNVNWSPDGSRLVYHTFDPGDPMYVADRSGANAKQIFVSGQPGGHTHFPTFSPDGRWIYFVTGIAETHEMDLWRIAATGGQAQRLTHHNNNVEYPTPIDSHTVLYISPGEDGSGPWLWQLDTAQKTTRRVSFGLEKYTSLDATPDGHRMVAAVANPRASLSSIPILDHVVGETDVRPYSVPSVRALAPRFGGGSLFYLSSRGAGDGLWRYSEGRTSEIWKGSEGALLEPAAVSPDGQHATLVLRRNGKRRLNIISTDGAEIQPLADKIDVQGTPSWSPDGHWIITGGSDDRGPGLFRVAAHGGTIQRIVAKAAFNPVCSPDDSVIVYSGPTVALWDPLLAVRPNGEPVNLPSIQLRAHGERYRFLPDGKGLVYMQGAFGVQDFWLLDLRTKKTRQLARLNSSATMRSFDITPDGKQIVFDRLRENSSIVLIDLSRKP